MNRYGWTLARYEEKVIRPYILQSKLSEKLSTDQKLRDEILLKAENTLKEIQGGMKFEDAALKYGEDGTASKGGDLGCFGKGEMVPQFETAIFAMKKGDMSTEVLETPFGFHIVRVDDVKIEKAADENGKMVNKDVVCARHIVFLFPSLEKELDTMVKQALVSWYVGKVNNPLKQIETN
jgi:parvulin-like peptidyl-prolyl isomerase